MFDDQNSPAAGGAGSIPNNLPIGEPDDMFSGTPDTVPLVPEPSVAPQPIEAAPPLPSAVAAGVLKPKMAVNDTVPRAVPQPVSPSPAPLPGIDNGEAPPNYGVRPPDNVMSEPFGGRKVLYSVIAVIALIILGGGGAWIYFSFINPRQSTVVPTIDTNITNIPPTTNNPPPTTVVPLANPVPITTTTPDERILFGEPILDTDGDSLDDTAEKKLGTDYLKWDTDGDALSDGDEVVTWKTDPLKADTDADGYSDSMEIKNGYNPKGPGKLFPVTPTTATSTLVK